MRPVPGGESAGRVCLQWFVRQAVCLLAFAMPYPLPSSTVASFCSFCFAPVHSMCARIESSVCYNMFASCKTVPLAATTRVCSGGPRAVLYPPHHYRCCKTACRQPPNGDCIWAAHAPLSATHKKGRPRTAFGQPARFPTPSFYEPETACEQPGSLLTLFLFAEFMILGHGCSVNL